MYASRSIVSYAVTRQATVQRSIDNFAGHSSCQLAQGNVAHGKACSRAACGPFMGNMRPTPDVILRVLGELPGGLIVGCEAVLKQC